MKKLIFLFLLLAALGPPATAQVVQWQKFFGSATENENASELLALRAGGYLLVGAQKGLVWLIRTNAQGDTVWTRRYAIPRFAGIWPGPACEDAQGRVLITGNGPRPGGGQDLDAFLLLVDTNARGDSLWTKQFSGPTTDSYIDAQLDHNGNFFVAGYLTTYATYQRISASGQILQQITLPPSMGISKFVRVSNGFWAVSASILNPANNQFYFISDTGVIGPTKPYLPNASSSPPMFVPAELGYVLLNNGRGRLYKLDASMDTVWSRRLTNYGTYGTIAKYARVTPDNNYVVLGEAYVNGRTEMALHKVSFGGARLRDTLFVRGAITTCVGLHATAAGSYVVAAILAAGPIGNDDLGLASIRGWTTTLAARPAAAAVGAGLQAWPNPARDEVRLQATAPLAGPLRLVDMLGREVRRFAVGAGGAAPLAVSVRGVAPGLYLLTAPTVAGSRATVRLLVE